MQEDIRTQCMTSRYTMPRGAAIRNGRYADIPVHKLSGFAGCWNGAAEREP